MPKLRRSADAIAKLIEGAQATQVIQGTQIGSPVPGNRLPAGGPSGSGYTPAPHSHDGDEIDSGVIDPARLGSGTADTTTFLRGDSTWATPSGGGGGTSSTAYASRPATGSAGTLFLPTDAPVIERDTGSAWVPWGPIFPFTAPPAASWTWDNQGDATVDTTNAGIVITAPLNAGSPLRVYYRTMPTPPYTLTTAVLHGAMRWGVGAQGCGICVRAADGKIVAFHTQNAGASMNLIVSKWTNSTTFSANYRAEARAFLSPLLHLRIVDDNTTLTFQISEDGQYWIDFYPAVSRTDFITPAQIGFVVRTGTVLPIHGRLLSWKTS